VCHLTAQLTVLRGLLVVNFNTVYKQVGCQSPSGVGKLACNPSSGEIRWLD
jgi:hypothetical protein